MKQKQLERVAKKRIERKAAIEREKQRRQSLAKLAETARAKARDSSPSPSTVQPTSSSSSSSSSSIPSPSSANSRFIATSQSVTPVAARKGGEKAGVRGRSRDRDDRANSSDD